MTCFLCGLCFQSEAQNKVLRSRVELLQKEIQDSSGASNAIKKVPFRFLVLHKDTELNFLQLR